MSIRRVCGTLGILAVGLLAGGQSLWAARVAEVRVVDQRYLMVRIENGGVTFKDDGRGDGAYGGHETASDNSTRVLYGRPLEVARATDPAHWTLTSAADGAYGADGLHPVAVHRKSRVNGMAQGAWEGDDYNYDYTRAHTLFLKLPHPLQQGRSYTLAMDGDLHVDVPDGRGPVPFPGRQGDPRLLGV